MRTIDEAVHVRPWWGTFTIPTGESRIWHIGPTRLVLTRQPREIRVVHWTEGEALSDASRVDEPFDGEIPEDARLDRFGFDDTPASIVLVPQHADRPVVTQPEFPFHLPPREQATIYVSLPAWLQIRAKADGPAIYEAPLFRPSDTWFGASTRIGELCYASRTAARLNLENLPLLPQRVAAAVHIQNKSSQRLDLERLKLPAPMLSVHASERGRLWTEKITLVRKSDGDAAELELSRKPPSEAGTTTFVEGGREKHTRGALLRSFGRILRWGTDHA